MSSSWVSRPSLASNYEFSEMYSVIGDGGPFLYKLDEINRDTIYCRTGHCN